MSEADMTPVMANLFQRVYADPQLGFSLTLLLGGVVILCLVICAIFSVGIFRKLCEIQQTLRSRQVLGEEESTPDASGASVEVFTAGSDDASQEKPSRRRSRGWSKDG